MTTVCLAVIAKNEAHVIARCLQSAKPIVDAWVVVDTGSTDATREIARDVMRDLPGEVVDRPWRGFAASRTESLELARARADYTLVLDADDVFEYARGARFPELTLAGYALVIHDGPFQYPRIVLMRSSDPWRFVGAMHERAVCDGFPPTGLVEGIVYRRIGGGARSLDPQTALNDATVLEEELRRDPSDARNVFYLARSYEDAGELPRALAAYERRVLLGGWDEEVFYAAYRGGRVREKLGMPAGEVARALLEAWHLRPQRAEPLYDLARLARGAGDWVRARAFAAAAAAIPRPPPELFLQHEVYAWRALDEFAAASAQLGDFRAAVSANRLMLQGTRLPPEERARVEANVAKCEKAAGAK
jgi:glycosyltransferase involved in cell wall biosynthesis